MTLTLTSFYTQFDSVSINELKVSSSTSHTADRSKNYYGKGFLYLVKNAKVMWGNMVH